ncbi:MAG: hypothetical protein Sapg2KO_47430 [Saprospiraceae bacterium]
MDQTGLITGLIDLESGINYLDQDTSSYLMTLRVAGKVLVPQSISKDQTVITLSFEQDYEAIIQLEEKEKYLTLELISLSKAETVDLVLWGPYANTIGAVIGETVGVVRNDDFAIGIQSLNIKTLGGYPWNESDRMPAFDFVRAADPNNMHPDADGSVLYRIEAGKPTDNGSSLQAYCRNRKEPRLIADFNHNKILAPAYEDGGVVGTKIALFGTPTPEALDLLGDIEVAEGLPHPMIDGQWGKKAPGAAAAYIITDFTEANVDQAIALTKQAGLKYLYHYGKTFENWGHFELFEGEFPNGVASLKNCVDQAEAQGVMLGTHFLSNFITTNDPYVTPIPDPRLAKVGSSILTEDVNAATQNIVIESPDFFNQMKNNSLKTVQIGDELIRYGKVSEQAPWTLLDCQRGAYGTKPVAHNANSEISKLLDHAYKVFLTEADLTIELSERMAKLYNQTGMRQISFDGLEGNRSTGLGTYGETLMPYTWYNNLSEEVKNHLIIDASRTTHFFWHIYSRMNWGEPWYGGFRESQTEYRFNNQAYFQRNYMPGMLGWFKMTPETSLEDMEWLLARAAGYEAGYAYVANSEAVANNGQKDQILKLIGAWENLRIGNHFSEAQKAAMRSTEQEFTIQELDNNIWNWTPIKAAIFTHEKKVRQPGEPLASNFEFTNIGKDQSLQFNLTAIDSDVKEIKLELNNYKEIQLPIMLKKGQILKYTGTNKAQVYTSNWQLIQEIDLDAENFKVNAGSNSLSFDCQFVGQDEKPAVKVELRTLGESEQVVIK